MSDHYTIVIPADPRFQPARERAEAAGLLLKQMAPEADDVRHEYTAHIAFYDCGENSEAVFCGECGAELETGWWQEQMDRDLDGEGFQCEAFTLPCCGARSTLNDLRYDWPQGFARFSVRAMNPDRGTLEPDEVRVLADALGTEIRVVYQVI